MGFLKPIEEGHPAALDIGCNCGSGEEMQGSPCIGSGQPQGEGPSSSKGEVVMSCFLPLPTAASVWLLPLIVARAGGSRGGTVGTLISHAR